MSKVYTGIDRSGSYRVYLAVTTDLVEEARRIHGTTPVATAGLGRVLERGAAASDPLTGFLRD